MKKFLSYSLIATVLIVVIGVLFIFGTFDFNFAQTNTIGSDQTTSNPVKIHNQIVDAIQDIALLTSKVKDEYNNLTPESDLNNLNNEVQTINIKIDTLALIFNKNSLKDTTDLFNNEYKPALDELCNKYLKALAYFEEKEFTQESIDSFKSVINSREQTFETAHNNLVEELNKLKI